jgi:hypothetical protein
MMALRFIGSVIEHGMTRTLAASGERFEDLCFDRARPIEFAIQLHLGDDSYLYELTLGREPEGAPGGDRVKILHEKVLRTRAGGDPYEHSGESHDALFTQRSLPHAEATVLLVRSADGTTHLHDASDGHAGTYRYKLSTSALQSIPELATHRLAPLHAVRRFMCECIRSVELDAQRLREPSAAARGQELLADGSNLAAAAQALHESDSVLYTQWVENAACYIDGLQAIDTWVRPEDRATILRAKFAGSHDAFVPQWRLSDGTLRLLALTLLAYSETTASEGIIMVEEPENGLHPLAMQCVHQALSAMHTAQVLVATHSPIFLAHVELSDALVFQRAADGSATVTGGAALKAAGDWPDSVRLVDVYGSGVV